MRCQLSAAVAPSVCLDDEQEQTSAGQWEKSKDGLIRPVTYAETAALV
ncbi:hypothetical protein T4D_1883 [Trichinella pseudospiralis]|uniref:Uncharacterized protein n=1 Tax=Trichinella pseudospiralis TaxID=6337 RepID=A0A0V1FJK4_TRIPS|nr:hypothetical protein T4D_1883 [Trichinella pseudospiralis]